MRFAGFIGPSYTLQSVNVECQRCVNLYPETDEAGASSEGEVASLVSTPGLRLLITLPTTPVRGIHCDATGQLWVVAGDTLYQITIPSSTWTATSIGKLLTASGPVSFTDNGTQAVVVDGTYGYFWQLATPSTYSQIIDPNFLGANQTCFLDSYLVFNKPGTQQFYLSGINSVTFNGLDIGSAEAHPDLLVGLTNLQENLYLFSQKHMEVWYDAGSSGFPFVRIQGAVIEIGCAAAFSIATNQTSVFWLGQDENGIGTVYKIQGLQPQRISTYAIENAIQSLGGDLSTARAWIYQQSGHSFYCLNLPGSSTTWVYDISTSLWHERTYLSGGLYQRHLVDCHAFAFKTNVAGDYSNGNIYAIDPAVLTDNGSAIRRERASPHISKDLNRLFHNQFWLDMEVGVGIDGTGQGTSPQAMLSWSTDNGHSWSNEHWTSIGAIGKRKVRAIWRRLGASRDRVYRIQITDPVKVTLLGAEISLTEGMS